LVKRASGKLLCFGDVMHIKRVYSILYRVYSMKIRNTEYGIQYTV